MAKARNKLANLLARTGSLIFKALSRFEDRGFLKGASHFLKLSLLGGLITLIGAISAQEPEEFATCYEIAIVPDVYITEIEADPNPTDGADSVTVRAKATVRDALTEGNIVTEAFCKTYVDSSAMIALDGAFDELDEFIEGRLSLEGLAPGTTWVWLAATASKGVEGVFAPVYEAFTLHVTEKSDSTEKDTTDR
ncbi:hypothetical protein JXM67_12705 [candidate division WOR-3 bacterium]|nr:hypothetical protein [candidate division WOR-3 bacterium]